MVRGASRSSVDLELRRQPGVVRMRAPLDAQDGSLTIAERHGTGEAR